MERRTDLTMELSIPKTMPHGILQLFGVLFVLYGLTTPNPLETFWYTILLFTILRLWMWKQHPGIFLFFFLLQFVESSSTLIQANTFGVTLNEIYPQSGNKTWWLATSGLMSVMLGTFWMLHSRKPNLIPTYTNLQEQAKAVNQTRLIIILGLSLALTAIVDMLVPYGSSLMQLETYTRGITNALVIALGIHFWITKQRPILVSGMFIIYIAISFYSYFSNWRDPFIIAFVSYLTIVPEINIKQVIKISPFVIPAIALVLIWQAVKGDYRHYLSGGLEDQAIRVTQSEALNKFTELTVNSLNENKPLDEEVIASTFNRAGYIEYFSAAVRNVPSEIPYQNGNLLKESLSFSLLPRILNPNKGIKNDREKVERFTNYYFGGSNNKSSFSLGHYCEAYIDWGPLGMMVHLFFYGAIGGVLYLITATRMRKVSPILTFGVIWAVLFPWATFQQDMVTVSGKIFWGSICHLILFFPLYKAMNRYIKVKPI